MEPAYIDEKNVTTDWIEYIFEYSDIVCNGNTILGFVLDCPLMAQIDGNQITWTWLTDKTDMELLKGRLKVLDDEDTRLVSVYTEGVKSLVQKLYFKDED